MTKRYLAFGEPDFGKAEMNAVNKVLQSGWIGMGQEVIRFEQDLVRFTGAKHIVCVNSCTSALFLSLLVNDIGPGDEVICPSFTWCSTVNAILYTGATPVFADIEADSFNLSLTSVREKLNKKTRAIILVHMGGMAVNVARFRKQLPSRIQIIEDAAHALGAQYPNRKPVGSSGNLTCFSFYANKNLSTGEGGAIALSSRNLAKRLTSLRLHGLSTDAWNRYANATSKIKLDIRELGYKHNYTDLQAAIGRVQLRRQQSFADKRLRIARLYQSKLQDIVPDIGMQSGLLDEGHARHLFQVLLPEHVTEKKRETIIKKLREKNIGATVHYYPLHHYQIYEGYASTPLPVTDDIGSRVITLPIGVHMTMKEAQYVVNEFISTLKKEL